MVSGDYYAYTALVRSKGHKAESLLLSDFGVPLIGFGFAVHEPFLQANPEVVRKFLQATKRGFQDAAADPRAACEFTQETVLLPGTIATARTSSPACSNFRRRRRARNGGTSRKKSGRTSCRRCAASGRSRTTCRRRTTTPSPSSPSDRRTPTLKRHDVIIIGGGHNGHQAHPHQARHLPAGGAGAPGPGARGHPTGPALTLPTVAHRPWRNPRG